MATCLRQTGLLLSMTVVSLFVWGVSPSHAQTTETTVVTQLSKITGQFENVVVEETGCGLSSTWPDSSADVSIKQSDGRTRVTIRVHDTVPDVFWTAWVGLVEGSPLTVNGRGRMPGMPMVPMDAVNDLAASTHDRSLDDAIFPVGTGDNGEGSADVPNGFWTDADGNGKLKIEVDFPIIKGAFPFHELNDDLLDPIAIGTRPSGPFTIRVVSHCLDNVVHGLFPGGELDPDTEEPVTTAHEIWFEWNY